jgi:glucosamine--fructose-6-phosphate aminotransferase (isomerizing)
MKSSLGSKTYDEILSQPDVWRNILNDIKNQLDNSGAFINLSGMERTILTGCGTTYALGVSAAIFFRRHGINADAYPASELAFYPELMMDRAKLLVAFSRSGMTSETLWAVKAYRKQCPDGIVCAITTRPDSTLARFADIVLDGSQAQEQSIVETCSFTGMYLAAQLLAAHLKEDTSFVMRVQTLPETLKARMPAFSALAQKITHELQVERYFFLGGGPLYGLASESAFKIKEFTAGWGEAFHPLEFRHGPMTAVNGNTLVAAFLSDCQVGAEIKVLSEMKARGGHTLAILETKGALDLNAMDYTMELLSGLDEFDRAVLYLPLIQLIAYYRSIASGLDPDNPQNLKAVTEL